MDGLTIAQQQKFIETGQLTSQLNSVKLNKSDEAGESFVNTLNQAIKNVDHLQKNADIKMQELATGKNVDIADVMIASEKAGIAFKLMVQVRNKIIDAYNEVMKMQV